jgi:hypothetical protein
MFLTSMWGAKYPSRAFAAVRSGSPPFTVVRSRLQWFAVVHSHSPVIKKFIKRLFFSKIRTFDLNSGRLRFFEQKFKFLQVICVRRMAVNDCEPQRTAANHCEPWRTLANFCESSRTAAKARERLFVVRFLKLRMARIVSLFRVDNFEFNKQLLKFSIV